MDIQSQNESTYRQYQSEQIDDNVRQQYRLARSNQTYDYAKKMRGDNQQRLRLCQTEFGIIEAIRHLDKFIDLSDPDISLPNSQHLFQTAEMIRNDQHPDWLQLVGLIHDLGKMLYLWGVDEEGTTMATQWGIVGDTYILGCALRNSMVYPEFDQLSPDMQNPTYNTKMGVYEEKCGIDNCVFTWGHDEYLYDVLQWNRKIGNVSDDFPKYADLIIRYHSLYPWHRYNEYKEFETEEDKKTLQWVQIFNKYDLYSKENTAYTAAEVDQLIDYYSKIVEKYFPNNKLQF